MNQKPFLKVRADNPFLHTNPNTLNDIKMWTAYIDMLARHRYNMIDFHGGYDFDTTQFPNLYPLLVTLKDFPQVGSKDIQNQNLEALKIITKHATDRCLSVGLMNYDTSVSGLSDEDNKTYTAQAVSFLLTELPGLKWIGFRVGESGEKAAFFEQTYLKGIKDSGRQDVQLYTRSWQTSKEELVAIAQKTPSRFYIEIKYNGEHLGLPYHAIHGGGASYSYQDYIQKNSPYDIIWQVRAGGTHRFLSWADPNFIRQAVKSFKFGNAQGFTLEPHTAYTNTKASEIYAIKTPWQYTWEKHWPWYALWGRLAYNPNLKNEDFNFIFKNRYGEQGPTLLKAFIQTGPIIPLAYSYRYQGPDHRNHSPETESGAFWQNHPKHHNYDPGWGYANLLSYGRNIPMDQSSFVGIKQWTEEQLSNTKDGRIGPLEILEHFSKLFEDTLAFLKSSSKNSATKQKDCDCDSEFTLISKDLMAEAALALFHKERVQANLYLHWGTLTKNRKVFEMAKPILQKSRDAWKMITDLLDPLYKPLNNMLRVKNPGPDENQAAFEWRLELNRLEDLDKTFEETWRNAIAKFSEKDFPKFKNWTQTEKDGVAILETQTQDNQITLTQAVRTTNQPWSRVTKAWLIYKDLPSQNHWQKKQMEKGKPLEFKTTLDSNKDGFLYKFEIELDSGRITRWPSPFEKTPWFVKY